jgi:nitroreductase
MENSKTMKDLMQWRFACKHFDKTKKIDESMLKDLLDTARLAPNSFGLQAWKFMVIVNDELKAKLAPACYNQSQITEASALVFFCARTDIEGEEGVLNRYMIKSQADLGKTDEEREAYREMIGGLVKSKSPEGQKNWVQRQVYLPAMTLILAAAEKGIDSCPMEGFNPEAVAEVLGLPAFMHPTVLVSLGYRNMPQPPKTRFDFDDVVEIRA